MNRPSLWSVLLMVTSLVLAVSAHVVPSREAFGAVPPSPSSARPLPGGADAYTEKNHQELILKWRMRVGSEAYEKVGRHNPEWDAAARRLLASGDATRP